MDCSINQPQHNVQQCNGLDGVQVECPDGEVPSVSVPDFHTCGGLRSYNLDHPFENVPRIVCGGRFNLLL